MQTVFGCKSMQNWEGQVLGQGQKLASNNGGRPWECDCVNDYSRGPLTKNHVVYVSCVWLRVWFGQVVFLHGGQKWARPLRRIR